MKNCTWTDLPYHFMIGNTEYIFEGRDLNQSIVHTTGYAENCISVGLFGNFSTDSPQNLYWWLFSLLSNKVRMGKLVQKYIYYTPQDFGNWTIPNALYEYM